MRISDWSSDVCSSDLAAVPAFLRRLPWPALQHRELCAAAAHAGAAMRSGAGRVHLDGRRHAYLQQPHGAGAAARSEEHTSELQSLMRISYAVFCLKKKKRKKRQTTEIDKVKEKD